jgi:arylsulfatase A-like enzyme
MHRRLLAVFVFPLLGLLASCSPPPKFQGPLRLLEQPTADGSSPKAGRLATADDARPALLESARWRVALPERPLLTFSPGLAYAGAEEAPGWFDLRVRAGERVIYEDRLNPRALRGFREVSLALEDLGRETVLEFSLAFTDREGRPIERPGELLLGVAEPTLHDLHDYGKRKGIVLISVDTLRRDHVGVYGYLPPTTPSIDSIGQSGITCDDAVSTSSWTLPAHLSMLTSLDPGQHGGTDMDHGFNGRAPILPALLRDAGYATQAITSHLYVSSAYGLDEGFDHLDFRQDRKAGEIVDRAIALLDRLGDEPFFLFLHFYDPHWHYDPPPEALAHFETEYEGDLTGLWQDFSRRDPKSFTEADLAHLKALYDGEIRYTDDQIARLLAHIDHRQLDRNTLLVLTSDHGEEFLEHGAFEHQRTLYDEVIRVPLILRAPDLMHRRILEQTSILDITPTILQWAGLPPIPGVRGRSLLGELPKEYLTYGETDHTNDGTRKLFMRDGARSLKMILSLDTQSGELAREEWYDLASDPAEWHASLPPPDIAAAIREQGLERWRQNREGTEGPEVSLSPEELERLRALGYFQSP